MKIYKRTIAIIITFIIKIIINMMITYIKLIYNLIYNIIRDNNLRYNHTHICSHNQEKMYNNSNKLLYYTLH